MAARNVSSVSAGRDLESVRNDYLNWVSDATIRLQNIFEDSITWHELHSEAFWRIRDLTTESPRWAEVITTETIRQATRIEALQVSVDHLHQWLTCSPGRITLLDTHVLLHFQPAEQINWVDVVGVSEVRLVLPLRVVEELDEKKYTARDELAQRARGVLSMLRTSLASSAGLPVSLREDVTIEVLVGDEPRRRTVDADQEILDVASGLGAARADTVLVTDDAAMDIRARALGLRVCAMPTKYLRQRSTR